jgi:hypothetical protein
MKAHDEIVEFIAGGPSIRSVADFRASPAAKARVDFLLRKEKEEGLLPDEKTELDDCETLEQVMNLAKARARQRLAHER